MGKRRDFLFLPIFKHFTHAKRLIMSLKSIILSVLAVSFLAFQSCTPENDPPAENCNTGSTSVQSCDDGDANTANDSETILVSDGSICVACAGTPVDCSNGSTTVQSCDDGDANTVDDVETTLDSDGTVCVPCAGTPVDCTTGMTSVQSCDDGNVHTVDDVETVLDSDGTVCVACAGTPVDCSNGSTTIRNCDDGDANTTNDVETILDSDGTVCVPCAGESTLTSAPNFSMTTTTGATLELSDYAGKNLVIFFFGNACPPCRSIAPSIESRIHQAYIDNDNLEIIGGDQWDGNNASVDAFANVTGATFPLGVMASGTAADFGTTYDRLVIINTNGKIVFTGSNRVSNHLDEAVEIIEGLLE